MWGDKTHCPPPSRTVQGTEGFAEKKGVGAALVNKTTLSVHSPPAAFLRSLRKSRACGAGWSPAVGMGKWGSFRNRVQRGGRGGAAGEKEQLGDRGGDSVCDTGKKRNKKGQKEAQEMSSVGIRLTTQDSAGREISSGVHSFLVPIRSICCNYWLPPPSSEASFV